MTYIPVPDVTAGDFGRETWADIVKDDLADHETRIVAVEASGAGDVVGPSSSVASEVALYDGTTGKLIKRATGTGYAKLTSGVLGTPAATVPLATDVSGNLPLANLPTNFAQLFLGSVTLNNAQIKALPTTPVQIVAAGGSGKRIVCIKGQWRANTSAGAYTNINATLSRLRLVYGANVEVASEPVIDSSVASVTHLTSLIGGTSVKSVPLHNWDENPLVTSNVENAAIQVSIDNNGSGDLTGGNAANTLRVDVLYQVL